MKKLLTVLLAFAGFVNAKDTIVFGVEGSDPPFQMINTKGELEGFDLDLAKALCDDLRAQCEFKTMVFDSLIQSVKQRKIDAAIASLDVTAARKRQVAFTNPYYKYAKRTVTSFVGIKDIDLKKAKTVGVQNGTTFQQYILAKHPEYTVKTYATLQDAILDLKNSRIDLVFGDVEVLSFLFKSYPELKFIGNKIQDDDFFGTGFAIAVNKKNKTLVDKFNQALQNLHNNGKYQQIYNKWLR